MNCNEAVAALIASLESGAPMTDEQREHIRICARCHELLDSAKQFQTLLATPAADPIAQPAADAAAIMEDEVVRARRKRFGVRLLIVLIAASLLVWLLVPFGVFGDDPATNEGLMVAFLGVALAVLVAAPLLLLAMAVKSVVDPHSGKRIFKRLGPGRMIGGVCFGLAERTGVRVGIIRLIFVLFLFFDGLGALIYILLDLFMPVHPDDRQYLWRFRLRRWLRGRGERDAVHHTG